MTFQFDFGVGEVIQAIKSDMTHMTSSRNIIGIEQRVNAVFWLVLLFGERHNFIWFS